MELTGKQRRFLRGLGHDLDAVVQIGKGGITSTVLAALDEALLAHELVKVKLGRECPVERAEAAEDLASGTRSRVAQILGKTILLYRRHPNKPKIKLPSASASKRERVKSED